MSKLGREKGKRFEREIAKAFDSERSGVRGKLDGADADVIHGKYYIQCKSRKSLALYAWFEKNSLLAEKVGKIPILLLKADRKKPLVVMELSEFQKEIEK